MKIIDQSHKILRIDSPLLIERVARVCYRSTDKCGCARPNGEECDNGRFTGEEFCQTCEDHSSFKFIRGLIKRGHDAMLEHAVATVEFVTDRAVSHELVRHRMASFAQESQRYVKYDDVEFVRPVWLREDSPDKFLGEDRWRRACSDAAYEYMQLSSPYGWLPEQARSVLPNSTATRIVVTANFREWRHIFKLRAIGTTGRPHPQMQALMLPVLAEFADKVPSVFGDLQEQAKGDK